MCYNVDVEAWIQVVMQGTRGRSWELTDGGGGAVHSGMSEISDSTDSDVFFLLNS
jgi:hypothetical protein